MDKLHMREYLADLETRVDRALSLWKKLVHHEDGETVQLEYQFEQCRVFLMVYWETGMEGVELEMKRPRYSDSEKFSGLTRKTAAEIVERVAGYAAKIKHQKPA